ncbi:hypothetical protein [Agrococcus sp. Ld7]|uniref:hypothetical protein n=1 Tax=Agrococcus sp. Ld7 TaxID=649148 RepID=UPI00386AF28C
MDEHPEREISRSTDEEARRRAAVLVELRRRRRRRRWTAGIAAAAASAIIIAGSAVAWSSQARAGDIAARIEAWHVEHELAGCELAERIVSVVELEGRATDVLTAAKHVRGAEWVLPSPDRAAFDEDRQSLLTAIGTDEFVTAADRELADAWRARAAASDDPASFDVSEACVTATAADREPIAGVTAERADALARQLDALGDPRDFDDSRIDRFEAALASLERSAVALARSRTGLSALQAALPLAPEQAKASLRDADRHLTELLAITGGAHTPSAVLDLVEGITLHVAAVWMTEAWQLEAEGDAQASAALAAQSQQAQAALVASDARPVARPSRTPPAPVAPPGTALPAPQPQPSPAPAPPTTAPTSPPSPPVGPTPSLPAPVLPEPEPPTEPEPPVDPAPPTEPEPPVDPTPPVDPAPVPGPVLPDPPATPGRR